MNRKPTATLFPARFGTWTVVKPDGRAEHANNIEEARRIALGAGAIVVRVEGPTTRETLWHRGNA